MNLIWLFFIFLPIHHALANSRKHEDHDIPKIRRWSPKSSKELKRNKLLRRKSWDHDALDNPNYDRESSLTSYGSDGERGGGHKLWRCEGDCDVDDDCFQCTERNPCPGHKLVCFQRNGLSTIPGCKYYGDNNYDYCVEQADIDRIFDQDNPYLYTKGRDPTHLLSECHGDCDNDNQCSGDLVCFFRDGSTDVPGCLGVGQPNYDYCIRVSAITDYTVLVTFGKDPVNKLGHCAGDCDNDDECAGDLVCHQRDGTANVPGCGGYGPTYGVSNYDYCVH